MGKKQEKTVSFSEAFALGAGAAFALSAFLGAMAEKWPEIGLWWWLETWWFHVFSTSWNLVFSTSKKSMYCINIKRKHHGECLINLPKLESSGRSLDDSLLMCHVTWHWLTHKKGSLAWLRHLSLRCWSWILSIQSWSALFALRCAAEPAPCSCTWDEESLQRNVWTLATNYGCTRVLIFKLNGWSRHQTYSNIIFCGRTSVEMDRFFSHLGISWVGLDQRSGR